jgi:hypothetical protein
MTSRRPIRERGAALLIMVMIIGLGSTWYLVSQLNAESGGMTAVYRARNALILNRAKLALIGYVAAKAAEAGENNPGRFPCPEAVNTIGTTSEGTSAPVVTPSTPTCNSIGRFPWRTVGLEKLVDTAGEPLWYVVGPSWRLTNSSSTLLINSDTSGDLTVDSQQVVALIIAPGAAMNAQSATGCTAHNQTRSTPAPSMDAANYIECFNSGTLQFVTTAASSSYNDQAVRITVADVMPAIEAAIANRIEREILPALQTVYTPATWGFSGSNPVLPFAAAFANPGSGAGTSNYQGAANTYAGLLPFNQTQGCTVSASDPRCTTTFLSWSSSGPAQSGGTGSIHTGEAPYPNTCSWESAEVFSCIGAYNRPTISLNLTVTVTNVAMGLRKLDLANLTFTAENDFNCSPCWGQQTVAYTATTSLNADGSATISVVGSALPDIDSAGWGTWATYKISFNRAFIGDHALLDTANATTGWFARNEWYRLVYYAMSPSNTAVEVATERSCSAAPADCLTVTNMTPSSSKSALLVLAGRSVNGSTRPSATLADYLEFGNANAVYEKQSVGPVPAMIYADTGAADAYNIAVTSLATGASFQFKATNANTGPSTLNTTATGTRSLVNADGSNLVAGTIQANAAIQVTWDGTQFLLSKRPFNDRFAAIASN